MESVSLYWFGSGWHWRAEAVTVEECGVVAHSGGVFARGIEWGRSVEDVDFEGVGMRRSLYMELGNGETRNQRAGGWERA